MHRAAGSVQRPERARAARFRFDRHRREFLTTHALARVALSHAHPLPPDAWSFSFNPYGKPSPIPECSLPLSRSTVDVDLEVPVDFIGLFFR